MIKYADADKEKYSIQLQKILATIIQMQKIIFSDIENWIEENETIEQVLRIIPSYVYGTDKIIPRASAEWIIDILVENRELSEGHSYDTTEIEELQQILDKWCTKVADMYLTDYEYKIDISNEIDEYLKVRKGR